MKNLAEALMIVTKEDIVYRDAAIKQIISDRKEQCAAVWHGVEFIQPSCAGSRSEDHIAAAINALSVAFDELLQAERLFTWGNTK